MLSGVILCTTISTTWWKEQVARVNVDWVGINKRVFSKVQIGYNLVHDMNDSRIYRAQILLRVLWSIPFPRMPKWGIFSDNSRDINVCPVTLLPWPEGLPNIFNLQAIQMSQMMGAAKRQNSFHCLRLFQLGASVKPNPRVAVIIESYW